MPCYKPVTALRSPAKINGKYKVLFNTAPADFLPIQLPCGQCIGCRLERSRQWAVRCMHEAQMHQENCFITLTYSDDQLPRDRSLHKHHFQKFMKRLRKAIAPKKVRYYMCGEYGDNTKRPHYHACLFGYDLPDKELFRTTDGINLYSSASLEQIWGKGFVTVGDVTFESAAYVARYVTKKITGIRADELDEIGLKHYEWLCPITGEVTELQPEYTAMSLKPGIGKTWLDKYDSDVYNHDHVIVNGKKCRPPRYYDKLLESYDSEKLEELKKSRQEKAVLHEKNNTLDRLMVREKVQNQRFKQLKRTL